MSARLHEVTELSAAQMNGIAEAYRLGALREFRRCSAGLINSNYETEAATGRYLVRVYAPHRKRENIAFEMSVLRHLSARGFPCQRPIPDASGGLIGSLGDRLFAVLTFLPGATLAKEDLSEPVCRQVGAAYAEMQRLLRGFTPEGDKPNADLPLIKGLVDDIRAAFEAHGVSAEDRARFESNWSELSPLFETTERSVVHADLYYQNVLFDGGRLTGIIDFDDAYVGSPLLDLALVTTEFSIVEDNAITFDLMRATLEAYAGAGAPIEVTPESLLNAARFQCFKFLGYTVELTTKAGGAPVDNDYYKRLVYLERPDVRREFLRVAGEALGARG